MGRPARAYRWVGWGLVIVGVVFAISVPVHYLSLKAQGERNLLAAQRELAVGNQRPQTPSIGKAAVKGGSSAALIASVTPAPATGAIIGLLTIPALALQAPIAQGTTPAVLAGAIGHLTASVLPGELGDTLLAAHNATWFRHVNRLRPGEDVWVQTRDGRFLYQVTASAVVRTGAPIAQSAASTLILESCYPLDALYLTPYRQLVFARLVADHIAQNSTVVYRSHALNIQPLIPGVLVRAGVTLTDVPVPMGLLHLAGRAALRFSESNEPLQLANAAEQLYAAWLRACSAGSLSELRMLQPAREPSAASWDQAPTWRHNWRALSYASAFDVTVEVSGTHVRAVKAEVSVIVGRTPYKVFETAVLRGQQLVANSFTWQRL